MRTISNSITQAPSNPYLDTISNIVQGLGTDRRFADQSASEDRRFNLRMQQQDKRDALASARADKRDALTAARNARLEQHYQDGLTYRNQKDAEAKADKIAALDADNASLIDPGFDFMKDTLVEDKSKIIGTELADNYSENTKNAPEVYSGFTEQADGTFKNDTKKLTTDENQLLTDYNMINEDNTLTAEQKKLAVMEKLISADELAKDKTKLYRAAESLNEITDTFSLPNIFDASAKAANYISTFTENSTEEAKRKAKESIVNPKDKSKAAYQVLVDKVAKLSNQQKSNKNVTTKMKASEDVFANWMKQYMKPKYAQKTVSEPVKMDTAIKTVKDYISKKEAKIDPNLKGIARKRKINAIRRQAAKGLDPYMKQRLKRIEKAEDLEDTIAKEQVKAISKMKTDEAKIRAKEKVDAREYNSKEAKKARALLAKEKRANIRNKDADTAKKNRDKS